MMAATSSNVVPIRVSRMPFAMGIAAARKIDLVFFFLPSEIFLVTSRKLVEGGNCVLIKDLDSLMGRRTRYDGEGRTMLH
jgi:hypothetical protein